MGNFFSQTACDRCGSDLSGGRMMSRYNFDCLCMKCIKEERQRPDYKTAQEAEIKAVLSGIRNYPGIGLT